MRVDGGYVCTSGNGTYIKSCASFAAFFFRCLMTLIFLFKSISAIWSICAAVMYALSLIFPDDV